MDDYTALKPLIDYKGLSELIALNEGILDPEKVQQFRKRYEAEQGNGRSSQASESEPPR
jgi:hypothetical protein